MADANLKPRRTRAEPPVYLSVALEQAPAAGNLQQQHKRPAFPWMQITDALLEQAGFLPGQHVLFSIDHRLGQITITPDRSYMIAGQSMTRQEIRQRDRHITD